MVWTVKRTPTKRRSVSLGEVLDAIEQNGLPQAYGSFWRFAKDARKPSSDMITYQQNDMRVESACAIGQGALNLGCEYAELTSILGTIRLSKGTGLDSNIIRMNDGNHWSVQRIAKFYRGVLKSRLDEKFSIRCNLTVEKG